MPAKQPRQTTPSTRKKNWSPAGPTKNTTPSSKKKNLFGRPQCNIVNYTKKKTQETAEHIATMFPSVHTSEIHKKKKSQETQTMFHRRRQDHTHLHPIAQEHSKKTAGTMHMVVQLHSARQNATRKKEIRIWANQGAGWQGARFHI